MTVPPIPDPDPASAHFFASLDAGKLSLLRCLTCATPHLAALTCDACDGDRFRTERASGRGVIHSLTRVHMAHHPAFAGQLPVIGGIVELAEGPRLFAPLIGDGPFAIGDEVRCEIRVHDGRGIAAFCAGRKLGEPV